MERKQGSFLGWAEVWNPISLVVGQLYGAFALFAVLSHNYEPVGELVALGHKDLGKDQNEIAA